MSKLQCIHCGEDCGKNPVMWDEKPFCCYGCKTVYQILNEKKLDRYYSIADTPGIKIESSQLESKYAYLDNEDIQNKILDFSDGGINKVSFFIPAIHCSSCIWLLENLHTLHEGIIFSSVNFVKKETNITFREDQITLRELVELLASIHYIPEITLEKTEDQASSKTKKNALLKLGVAGFCFGNIMLFSFPEYLPGGELLEKNFKYLFSWLGLILAIPVVIYSGNDYILSAIKGLKKKIINIDVPITLGILTIFIQSSYEIISGNGKGYMDSLAGLVFFLLIGKWYQNKTYQALSFERDYKSYFPVAVTQIVEGKESSVPIEELKAGDIILIRNQELIPADSNILNGDANIDYSFVTGESLPVPKKSGDHVYAGGRQVGSSIELEIEKAVEQSYLTQLWNQDKNETINNKGLQNLVNKVSQYFTVIILFIATFAGIYWLINDSSHALNAFTSVLIIACPCALALTIPFTFGSIIRLFGRKGLYLKKTEVIEHLSKINTIVFDKTGTLTHTRSMHIEFTGNNLSVEEQKMIKSLVRHSTHPVSSAVFDSISSEQYFEVEDFREIPAMGISGYINGQKINIGSETFVKGKKTEEEELGTKVFVNINNNIPGFFTIENKYRNGLEKIIKRLIEKFSMHLLSGDNSSEQKNLLPLFRNKDFLHFNQSPSDKLAYIRALKEKGQTVLMVGDGLNDAGALNESDVGITIADDIYHFAPACDAILESKKFEKLDDFILFTSTGMKIVYISFVISFLYNLAGLFFAVQGILSPIIAAILMPVSSVSVVAFATLAVSLMAERKGI